MEEKKWYVVNTYSGHEAKVKEKLDMRINSMDMQENIFRVIVPERKEVEIKELDYTKSRKLALPKLKYSGSINQLSDESTLLYGLPVAFTKSMTLTSGDLNYSNKLVLEQPIYTGGAIASGIKLLNINKDLEQVKLDQKKREEIISYLFELQRDRRKNNIDY